MRLEIGSFDVGNAVFSDKTRYSDGVLYISKAGLQEHLSRDSSFKAIKIDIARPGEETRIIHALDVVEPRTKVSGPGHVFPGVLGEPVAVGQGVTNRLAGVAVVGAAEPFAGEDYWYAREAIIDMSGPGADYSPFSRTINVVLTFVPDADADSKELASGKSNYWVDSRSDVAEARTETARVLSLRAADYLAGAAKGLEPDRTEVYELTAVDDSLPKVVYIHHNIGCAPYGSPPQPGDDARYMHPNELMDGALVTTTRWVQAALRDCTYLHQNNSLVQELYSRHGKDLNFVGVIFFTGFGYGLEDKERESNGVVEMARKLGADGAVITPLRPGHSCVTHMMVCQKCERAGIRTAIGVGQLTTARGDPGLNYWVPEADAMAIPGDDEYTIHLPAMKKVIGGAKILNSEHDASGAIETSIRRMYSATTPLGPGRLSGRLY